jgi:hypothetical protein
MHKDLFTAVPKRYLGYAEAAVRAGTQLLAVRPNSALHSTASGNLQTDETRFRKFEQIDSASLAECAQEAHLEAASIDADYVIVVLDTPGPPRTYYIGMETHEGCYEMTLPVVRGKRNVRKLGPGKFARVDELRAPFEGMLTARVS